MVLKQTLARLIIPSVRINGFCIPFSKESFSNFSMSFGLASLSIARALLVVHSLFPQQHIEKFAAPFSNAGFIGIPLEQAAIGEQAVLYITGIDFRLTRCTIYGGNRCQRRKRECTTLRNMARTWVLNASAASQDILLGTVDRWNDAKRSELDDRVKHA